MVNKKKIILMSKLAVYDKKMGENDRKVSGYYRNDYIYSKNVLTRIYVALATVALIACYWGYQIFVNAVDVFSMDYEVILADSAKTLLFILIFYSIVGTVKATIEYGEIRKRLSRYFKLLNQLDKMRIMSKDEFEEASENGADITNTGNYN